MELDRRRHKTTRLVLLIVVLAATLFPAIAEAACQIPQADSGVQLVNDVNACLSSVSAGGLPGGAVQGQFLGQGAAAPAWFSLSGDLSCSATSTGSCQVVGFRGIPLSNTSPTNGQVPTFNSTLGNIQWGSAGGSGNLPSGATEGQFLLEGVSAAGWFTLGGDASSSATAPGQVTINTVKGGQTPVTTNGATAGSFPVENAAANGYSWSALGGDVTNSPSAPGSISVVGIRGIPVTSTAPTNGFVLSFNSVNNDFEWVAQTGGSPGGLPGGASAGQFLLENASANSPAWFTLSGDVSSSATAPGVITINTVKGGQTPVTTNGAQAGFYPVFTGSAIQWALPAGDVAGSTSTPGSLTVTHLQGRTVSSIAPSGGQCLGWNSTGSDWEPTACSSAGGGVGNGSTGQFFVTGTAGAGWFTLGGDVVNSTTTPGAITVKTIGGATPVVNNGGASLTSLTTQALITPPSIANPGTSATVAGANSDYDIYLTSSITYTLGGSSPGVGSGQFLTFNVHQPASGGPFAFTLTAAAGSTLKWATGSAPTECTTANCLDVYQCEYLGQITTFACGITLGNVH